MQAETHSPGATKEDPQGVAVTSSGYITAKTLNVEHSAAAQRPLLVKPHEDFDISIIWQNLADGSNFMIFRKESRGPIERILVDFARVLELNLFEEVVSVNASKHLFCVTVICTKNMEDGVRDAILSVL